MSEPLETEDQARQLPAVRAIWEAVHATPRRGVMAEHCHKLMENACTTADVQIGAYDHRILIWLSGWEPQICAVVAGLVTRAAAGRTGLAPAQLATVLDALDVAADYKRDRAAVCGDCDASPADLCDTCAWRLRMADEYDALAAELIGAGPVNWTDHGHPGEYAGTSHSHGFYELLDVAEEHHRHYDHESEIAGLREDLGRALERIRDLEDRCAVLDRQTPAARQAQYEADLAAADVAESGYDRDPPIGADRHGLGCQCPYCYDEADLEPELEGSRLAERDAYIGTWNNQDVTRSQP